MVGQRERVPKYTGVYIYRGQGDECFHVNFRLNGKLKWHKVGWKKKEGVTAAFANQERIRIMNEIRRGEYQDSQCPTVREAWDAYHEWMVAHSKKGIEADLSRYRTWIDPRFGDTKLKDISISDTERFQNEMLKKLSPGSNYQVLTLLRRIYSHARYLRTYLGPCAVQDMKEKKNRDLRAKKRFLTEPEAETLLEALQKRSWGTFQAAYLALWTGMRKNELMKLKGRDVNLEARSILLRGVKDRHNQRSVTIPIDDMAYNLLKDMDLQDEKPVFPDFSYNTFRTVVKGLGLKDVTFHTLRHTFASWRVQAGMDLEKLKDLLGHTTSQHTSIYAHLSPGAAAEATREFAKQYMERRK